DMVRPSGIKHAELLAVTQENYDELLWQLPSAPEVVGGGLTFAAFVSLYPFVVAWRRGKITQDQFKAAVHRVFGTTSRALVSRLALTVALGPVFGWYLLARGAGFLAQGAIALAEEPELEVERTTYVLRPGASLSQ